MVGSTSQAQVWGTCNLSICYPVTVVVTMFKLLSLSVIQIPPSGVLLIPLSFRHIYYLHMYTIFIYGVENNQINYVPLQYLDALILLPVYINQLGYTCVYPINNHTLAPLLSSSSGFRRDDLRVLKRRLSLQFFCHYYYYFSQWVE